MPLKYNPLLRGGFDESKRNINDLEDVNTAGTVDGYVLAWEESSGTWKPSAAGAGDMLKSDYDQLDDGVVDNSERLEGETLGSVQAHTVDAINVLGTLTDANIPDVETLSYGVAFADGQIPTLDASKIISGTFDGGQIPNLGASKITSGTFVPERIPELPTTRINEGTFDLGRIPSIDDARIPNLETLSYGGTFAEGQIPNLPTTKITSGTFGLARIPSIDNAHLAGGITSDKIPALSGTAIAYPINADTVGTTQIIAGGVANSELAASGLDISKFTIGTAGVDRIPSLPAGRVTTGTFGLARIPTMDDAHIPDLETLSYGAAFGTAQIPTIGAYKIASGTLNADRIPALPTARITSGTFNADRIPILPTDRYGSAVLLTGDQSIGGTKTFSDIPILPASNPTADNEAARKAYVDSVAGAVTEGTYSSSFTFGSAQAIQDAGTAFTIGGFMTHGYIKEVDFRANYTCGTLTTVSAKVNNASGILPAGTVIANDGRVGTFFIGDYIESENEIMRISGTVSPGTLYVSRGKKGSGAGFIDDNEDIIRANSGFTMQLFKNSNKKKHEMPLQLSSLMCAKGVTDASMSSGGKRIQLSADLKNVDNLDTVRIDDGASSEEALVQNNVGDCVAGTYDYNLYVYDTLGSHPSGLTVEKVCKYDIPTNYKSTAGTLYGRLQFQEASLGSNLNINVEIKTDEYA